MTSTSCMLLAQRRLSCVCTARGHQPFASPKQFAHKVKPVRNRGSDFPVQVCKSVIPDFHVAARLAFLSPVAFILESIFSIVALSIGAAFTFAFGGALFAGAVSTLAFAMAIGGILWVGMFLAVALPVMLAVGAVGAFMMYQLSQPEKSKEFRETARKQMLEFEKQFGRGTSGSAGATSRGRKVIDIDIETEVDKEVRTRMKEVDEELSDFDRRLRGRFFD